VSDLEELTTSVRRISERGPVLDTSVVAQLVVSAARATTRSST
jgi:hypothetical protein